MRIIFLSLASFFLFTGCMERMMQEELAAEHNMINWQKLEIGMNETQVLNTMSFPDRKEFHVVDGREYSVWFYLTNPTKPVFVKKFSKKNFSPVVFRCGVLVGWGYDFYNYVFDVKEEKRKMEEEKRMKYTDHPEEWPANEVGPINELSTSIVKSDATARPPSSVTTVLITVSEIGSSVFVISQV